MSANISEALSYRSLSTPIGPLLASVSADGALVSLRFEGAEPPRHDTAPAAALKTLDEVERQIAEYFSGERRVFQLPLDAAGTEFQQSVWRALTQVPWGETESYGDLARRVGNPKAVRAVGRANGANPIPIVVPCHRVIGADGSLTGYASGVERKRWLLEHEGVLAKRLGFTGRSR